MPSEPKTLNVLLSFQVPEEEVEQLREAFKKITNVQISVASSTVTTDTEQMAVGSKNVTFERFLELLELQLLARQSSNRAGSLTKALSGIRSLMEDDKYHWVSLDRFLEDFPRARFVKLPSVGRKTIVIIEDCLHDLGLRLGMSRKEFRRAANAGKFPWLR